MARVGVDRNAPIGVMDSGVGGLSILKELHRQLPHEDYVFVADQANVPYGPRTLHEVQQFTEGIMRFFIDYPTKIIVIACNTASAAALHHVRAVFPETKFVGIEPAVKPAAEQSQQRKIGVIATAATFQGELYASLIDKYTQDVEVYTRACPEFVQLVERGGEFTAADQQLVCDVLAPLVEKGIDQLVLGCTHFPFLTPLIRQCVGEQVEIVDPSPAIARQTARILGEMDALTTRQTPGKTLYLTSGNVANFHRQVDELMGIDRPNLQGLIWAHGDLKLIERIKR